MKSILERASRYFEITLDLRSRMLLLVAALSIVPTFMTPLWRLTLISNQFPEGLVLNIYTHRIEGGQTLNRDDLKEINALNHYIGMKPLREEDFTEFKWIPFVLGGIGLLALRAMVLGKVSKLVDLIVLFGYFGIFSLWSFYHKLYLYGHDLDPTAAVKVPPFTPPIIGHQTMANFEVYSYPATASYFMVLCLACLILALGLSVRNAPK